MENWGLYVAYKNGHTDVVKYLVETVGDALLTPCKAEIKSLEDDLLKTMPKVNKTNHIYTCCEV
jgi:hypothetical protein